MAMTSVTRSRRADGLYLSHPKLPTSHRLTSNPKADQQFAVNPPRAKRQLEPSGRDFDPTVTKRTKFTTGIAVEIPARSSFHHSRFTKEHTDVTPPAPAPPPAARAKATTVTSPNTPTQRAPPAKTENAEAAALTKHQEKVANGLKHELNRLQPNAVDTKEPGRKLRSQESVRHKSELSNYFPDYDEVIGNEPKEQPDILTLETPIVITSGGSSQQPQLHPRETTYPVRSYGDSLFTDLFDSQRIDFSFLNKGKTLDEDDSLPDTLFEPAHKKAERLERSIRNSEKGRAQHEKDQIIRLLDGLQGHDWLRVMGVSGITESRKKAFEPAREHFIKGCEAILDKFRRWAAEEKRRKQEKDRAAAAAGRQAEREAAASEEKDSVEAEEEEDEEEVDEDGPDAEEEVADSEADVGEGDDDEEEGEPPDDNNDTDVDVDASIAKQLREEALAAAAKKKAMLSRRGGRGNSKAPPPPPVLLKMEPEPPAKEFTSFFTKRYLRDAALSKSRRRGRKAMAWGQPVPDVEEADFELPVELRDEHILRTRARGKRRDKRGKQ